MKLHRFTAILLAGFLVLASLLRMGTADVLAASPPQGDMESAIIQALEATARELGITDPVGNSKFHYSGSDWEMWILNQLDTAFIAVTDCGSESTAQDYYNRSNWGYGRQAISFHGYPALYDPVFTASTGGQTLPDNLQVRVGRYYLSTQPHQTSVLGLNALELAEVFYRYAVTSRFMRQDGSTGPGITPTVPAPPTVIASPGAEILLSAGRDGYETVSRGIANPGNFGSITITGFVRDLQTGSGIPDAVVQVVSGASPGSTTTSGDGSYSLVVSVPGGQESGQLDGLDFTLQGVSTLRIQLQASNTSLPADGVSTTDVSLQVTDPNGTPLAGRAFDFLLQGQDGIGSLQLTRDVTDGNGALSAVYTSFKPAPGTRFASHQHLVTIIARDRLTGEQATLDLDVNQNQIIVTGNQTLPACPRCVYPALLHIVLRDAWGNPMPDQELMVRLEGAGRDQGTLVAIPDVQLKFSEQRVKTDQEGRARLYYRWLGTADVTEFVQEIVITEEQTSALVSREIQVHGLDLAITRVEEAGFTGITDQQAFLKIYVRDRLHPDLPLDRFNLDSLNQVCTRVTIRQYESEGDGTSFPFESTGGLETDASGTYLKLPSTPSMPYVIPVNDGTTWFDIRVDAVDSADLYIPDAFRGNNDVIIALTTGSPSGWLHTWIEEGILTPHSYFGVMVKCVARFLPGVGDAITVIDTLNQVYNQDVASLGESTAQMIAEQIQSKGQQSPGMLTRLKVSALNNVVSCMQDAHGVYRESAGSSNLPLCKPCSEFSSLDRLLPCAFVVESEDFDLAAFQHALDQFAHGLLLDSPEDQAVLVFGLPPDQIKLQDAQGREFNDPDRMSVSDGVAVFILPVDQEYTLQVQAGDPFDVAVHQAGGAAGTRETLRHAVQTDRQISASLQIGGTSDYSLFIDDNGDGIADRTSPGKRISHDLLDPVITGTKPVQDALLFLSSVTIAVDYADDPAGSGVDVDSVRVWLDGQDLTPQAAVSAAGLTLQADDLPAGEHQVQVEVGDRDGNRTRVNWTFKVDQTLSVFISNPNNLLVAVLVGVFFVFLGGFVLLLVLLVRWMAGRRAAGRASMLQDAQGRWWMQDSASGAWLFWSGSAWLPWQAPVQGAIPASRPRGSSCSCLLVVVVVILLGVFVLIGGYLAYQGLIPGVSMSKGGLFDLGNMLKIGGAGLLLSLLGMLVLNTGFRAVQTRRARVNYGRGNIPDIREVRNTRAVIFGIGQVGIGLALLLSGLVLMALMLFQHILPGLGL